MKSGFDDLVDKKIYRDYRRRLDPYKVLDYYDAEHRHEISGEEGSTEVVHSCLLDRVEPHHSNGDRNPSACMNIERKTYICYSFWGGDLFHFIMKMEEKKELVDIISVLPNFLVDAVVDEDTFKKELEELFSEGKVLAPELSAYHPVVLKPWAFTHPYVLSRGITEETCSELQIGWDDKDNRITFPLFWGGKLIGFQKRAIPNNPEWPGTSPDIPKYKNSPGFPKSQTLYNLPQDTDCTVIVVESPMSVAKAHSLGFKNVTCTFGAKVSDVQIDYLKSFRGVTVWFDSDRAGRIGEKKLVRGLYRHTNVGVVIPDKDKDLGDCSTIDEVQEKLSSVVPAFMRLADYDIERKAYHG